MELLNNRVRLLYGT